jgi:hypothetical protein
LGQRMLGIGCHIFVKAEKEVVVGCGLEAVPP